MGENLGGCGRDDDSARCIASQGCRMDCRDGSEEE